MGEGEQPHDDVDLFLFFKKIVFTLVGCTSCIFYVE
jgi:hypothetical protein